MLGVSTPVIVYVLTALAAVVVVLTRLRLGQDDGAGRLQVGIGLLNLHTGSGVLALVTWVVYLVADSSSPLGSSAVGIVALFFWWVVVVCGLLVLVRWMPSHGRHASSAKEDTWSEGPGLSVLAHVGMFVGVCVFTWAYLTAAV